ncbi:outer membrane lipoprotein-sorting protein [Methylacidiphilum caldifontis]|uniref:Outer membrane lipoprotein-sorting protein n=1 Tax=Methylacidiphilum caldifontis TaxID=2795386 RepID=A0A4Y8P9Q3_9BACT|nr:outer membrane lipoprotein-sorting protein [Methylacidiphilum caldifontis]TFE67197.1 outer membrane lipoprotein-sorting protein [Methylacidiphilum caldifontis]
MVFWGKRLLLILFFLNPYYLFSLWSKPNPDKPSPPLEFIQGRFWRNFRLKDYILKGSIQAAKDTYPITLILHDRSMEYHFIGLPLQIHVEINPDNTYVAYKNRPSEPWQPITGLNRTKHILNTDISYEDLCLDFIRWDKIKPLGTDSIKTLSCWAFDAYPGSILSAYAKVRYWIAEEYYALLRVEGYNKEGQIIKRLDINSVQRIGDAYVIKEMQIATIPPGKTLSSSKTYIQIEEGRPASAKESENLDLSPQLDHEEYTASGLSVESMNKK